MSKAPPPISPSDEPAAQAAPADPAPRGRKPIVQCTAGEWRDMVQRLRACCPAPEGWSWKLVRSRTLGDDRLGECGRQRNRVISIRVAFGMSQTETLDTLIHEMAHGYDMWTHHSWPDDHSDTFWIWVGRIYRRFHAGY